LSLNGALSTPTYNPLVCVSEPRSGPYCKRIARRVHCFAAFDGSPHGTHAKTLGRGPGLQDGTLCGDPAFRGGFAVLADMGLSFDTYHYHHQNRYLTELARAFPSVRIVNNHLGTPLGLGPYANRKAEVFEEWARYTEAEKDSIFRGTATEFCQLKPLRWLHSEPLVGLPLHRRPQRASCLDLPQWMACTPVCRRHPHGLRAGLHQGRGLRHPRALPNLGAGPTQRHNDHTVVQTTSQRETCDWLFSDDCVKQAQQTPQPNEAKRQCRWLRDGRTVVDSNQTPGLGHSHCL
jgi:hypothetical protein